MSTDEMLRKRIAAFDGNIRLMVRTFDGREFCHQADETSDPVSVIKLAYLHEAFHTLDLTERVTIAHDPKASGWGMLRRLTGEVTMCNRVRAEERSTV